MNTSYAVSAPKLPALAEGKTCVKWYRTAVDGALLNKLHERNDGKGLFQAGGWLGLLLGIAAAALWSQAHLHWAATATLVFLYGVQANFAINGMHELGHGQVFQTRWLTHFFLRTISLLGWLHPDMFFASHIRHHRFTLNFPRDQEVVLPVKLGLAQFLEFAVINPRGFYDIFTQTVRAALNRFPTGHLWWTPGWEVDSWLSDCSLYSVSYRIHLYSWHHPGLNRDTNDFRLCCRTFNLNPVVRFLYWQMNYHTEHHMYAAVPCYNLGRLHEAIKHELPPVADGLIAACSPRILRHNYDSSCHVWRQILPILHQEAANPSYVYKVPLPAASAGG
eukprot:gene11273-2049_t